jgi:acyl-CoA synthetase (AMP-forming)/AMP-acid ligase II
LIVGTVEQLMATLTTAIHGGQGDEAVIIPGGPQLTYRDLLKNVAQLQTALAKAGLQPKQAVSISLANNLEFVLSFLAVGNQRCIAGESGLCLWVVIVLTFKSTIEPELQASRV